MSEFLPSDPKLKSNAWLLLIPVAGVAAFSLTADLVVAGIAAAGTGVALLALGYRTPNEISHDQLQAVVRNDLREAQKALRSIKGNIKAITKYSVKDVVNQIYTVADKEIVGEILAEPQRATPKVVFSIKDDLQKFAKVLDFYVNINSGDIRLSDYDSDFESNLEKKFFPRVLQVFKSIATRLDENDVEQLEQLVRSLDTNFEVRGLTKNTEEDR